MVQIFTQDHQIIRLRCFLTFYLDFSLLICTGERYGSALPGAHPLILFMFAYS